LHSGHFYGFYNAFNDYFTHHVGPGLDFRDDVDPVRNETGNYFTEIVTANGAFFINVFLIFSLFLVLSDRSFVLVCPLACWG